MGNSDHADAGLDQLRWVELAERLEAEKRRLYEAIRTYPTPIAGCDQQFNHLLAEQARVSAELERVRQAIAHSGGAERA
jgi:hypothetical protein